MATGSGANFGLGFNEAEVTAAGPHSNTNAAGGSSSGGSGVTQLIAGSGITLSPTSGLGTVTVAAPGAAGGITQLTGDIAAGPGAGSQVATLPTVNPDVGSFTSANITVNAKGQVTAAANGSGGGSGITQLTGDVTAGPGSGSQAATLASVVTAGSVTNASITFDAKGRITVASSGGSGGTLPLITVPNRSELRGTPLTPGNVMIEELGYAETGDGGGGLWVVLRSNTTLVDDDGTIVVPNSSGGMGYGTTSTDMVLVRAATQVAAQPNTATLDVRWFGANVGGYGGDCRIPVTHAFAALKGGPGELYFPSGMYGFPGILVLNLATVAVSIRGDGPSTELAFNFSGGTDLTTNYCMLQIQFPGAGSYFGDFLVSNRPIQDNMSYPPSLLRFTGGTSWRASNITFDNYMVNGTTSGLSYVQPTNGSQLPQGALWIEGGTACTVDHIWASGFGTAIMVGGGSAITATSRPSVDLHHCWLAQSSTPVTGVFANGVMGAAPTLWIENADTCMISEVFVENGGPYRYFQGATITSSGGSQFTVTTPGGLAHNFVQGDYIVINGATNTGFNHKWRVHSVTATSVTVTSNPNGWTITGSETSVYFTSLFCAVLIGGGINRNGGGIGESTIRGLYTNTGGRLIEGTVGVYFCARNSGNGGLYTNAGITLDGVYSDFGECSVFFHGTAVSSLAPPGSCSHIQADNLRANGGPRSNFGMIRLEQADDICIANSYAGAALTAYTVGLITPAPPAGNWAAPLASPMVAIAICDGGGDNPATYGCMDIGISGGTLQSVSGSAGISPLVSSAILLDGPNSTRLKNIRERGSLYDPTSANSTPITYLNGATSALIDNDL